MPGFLSGDDEQQSPFPPQNTPHSNMIQANPGAAWGGPNGGDPPMGGGDVAAPSVQPPAPAQSGGFMPPVHQAANSFLSPAQPQQPQNSPGGLSGFGMPHPQGQGAPQQLAQPQQPQNGTQGGWSPQSPQTTRQNGQQQRKYYGEQY
jgi:hypothetical protein